MTALSTIRLVAARELAQRLSSKTFYLLTAALVLIILAIGVVSRIAGDDEPGMVRVGVAQPVPHGLEAAVAGAGEALGRAAEVAPFDDVTAARAALDDGDVDALLLAGDGRVELSGAVDDVVVAITQQAWAIVDVQASLADAGLTPDQIASALATTPLQVVSLDDDEEGPDGLAVLVGTMTAVLLFISLQTFGGYVLQGVVEEKSTAVIEVLLVRARADHLLAGKVIAIGLAALLQFFCAVAAGMVSLALSGASVPSEIWSMVPMALLWFLGGYALYSTLFALAGSLVSRQEDAQAASAPILTALIGAYMLVFIFGYVPESTASRVMSVLPPIAPLLMPMRMAAGAASVVEIVVALGLLFGSTYLAWKLAGRIYEQVVLRRGSRISWRDAFSLVRR